MEYGKGYVTISHDAFGRYEIVRFVSKELGENCADCGNRRPGGNLLQYGILKDGIKTKPIWDDRLFCSKSCRDAYYS